MSIDNYPFLKDEIFLGTQYWRFPTPERKHWKDDVLRLKETGLDIVQFRLQWIQQEPVEGQYNWSELDELFDITERLALELSLNLCLKMHLYGYTKITVLLEFIRMVVQYILMPLQVCMLVAGCPVLIILWFVSAQKNTLRRL